MSTYSTLKAMKTLIARISDILPSLFSGRLSFRSSFLLSVAAHLFGALLVAAVLMVLEQTNLYEPPLVFDFVFAPSETLNEATNQGDAITKEDSAPAYKQPPVSKETEPAKRPMQTKPEKKPLDKMTPGALLSERVEESYEASKIEKELTEDKPEERDGTSDVMHEAAQPAHKIHSKEFLLSAMQPSSFVQPIRELTGDETFSASITMGPKEKKMLRKRFKKWTENFYKMDLTDSTVVWKNHGKTYSARFKRAPARTQMDIDEVSVEIEKAENGVRLCSSMRMKRLAFSNFAQFVDRWDPWVAVHDDEMEGRFHANSKINIVESRGVKPKFYGKVTTASYDVNTHGSRPFFDDKTVFLGGLETGVKAIALPRTFDAFSDDSASVSTRARHFDDETWLIFKADGSYAWRAAGVQDTEKPLAASALYLVGAKKKKLHVKGVVKGKILVYSPGDIVIDGDLTYARHPEASMFCEDYLGIVSDKNIEIAHPSVTGPGDLNIYGALYAKRRFVVRHLKGSGDDTLLIYGSLTAGSISATEPRYGTRIRFDKRLERNRPPNFPMTNRYEVKQWDGRWEVRGQ